MLDTFGNQGNANRWPGLAWSGLVWLALSIAVPSKALPAPHGTWPRHCQRHWQYPWNCLKHCETWFLALPQLGPHPPGTLEEVTTSSYTHCPVATSAPSLLALAAFLPPLWLLSHALKLHT